MLNCLRKHIGGRNVLAQLTSRGIADVLADTLELSLPTFADSQTFVPPVDDLSNDELLALTELQMEDEEDSKLSSLLFKQQAGELTATEPKRIGSLDANLSGGPVTQSPGFGRSRQAQLDGYYINSPYMNSG